MLPANLVAVVRVVHGPLGHREGEVHGPAGVAVEGHVSSQDPASGVEPNPVASEEGVALPGNHHVFVPVRQFRK